MKKIILFLISILAFSSSFGQSTLNGKVVDNADKKPLTNASIILLNQDSILQHFTRADEDGNFQFKNIPNAAYIFLITYPKFEVYSKNMQLNENMQLPSINLNSRANLIEEVVIKQNLPIRIKGDTIEYNAASFETEKNAKLEDLFRRLPGMTVSADGTITAQGKSVSKVLIDGEEFFGYDPKIAIRNVRADAVDKVQVYERKSRQTELTGIDDGERLQTINVVLKEEARKGIFGNIEALAGTEELYTANLFAAKFNRTERFGITANTNNMGANSGGREGSLRSNSRITGDPRNTSIGANYENQLFNKNVRVNANYNFNDASNKNETTGYSKEVISPTEIQETNNSSKNSNTNQGHNANARFDIKTDSSSNLNVDLSARTGKSTSAAQSQSSMTDGNATPIRDFSNNNDNFSSNNSNDIRLNYRKRLNKKGSSLNININNSHNESNVESKVNQQTIFYTTQDTVNINQNRITTTKANNFSTQLNYSDRLMQQLNYSLGYSFSSNTSTNKIDAEDLFPTAPPVLNMEYSQNQKNNNLNQAFVLNLNYMTDKYSLNVSNRTNYKDQKLIDNYRDINLSRSFWDNDINASINYKISTRKNINIDYQNNYDVPSFEQLQPLQPQTNPIFIQEGNPNLKKAINNSLRINYNTISILKGINWNINSSISLKTNPIVNKRTIDEKSVTTSTFVNVDGKSSWNANINSNYSKPMFGRSVQFNITSGANYTNGFSYIRNIKNATPSNQAQYELTNAQNTNIFTGFSFNEQNSKGLDFDFSWRVTANNQRNNLQPDLNYTNLATNGNTFLKYFLPYTLQVAVNAVYSLEGPTKFYNKSTQQFYTNLALEKKLLKSQSLTASIKAYDIFKTYNNINRNQTDINFSETTQLTLTRYVLFGLKWDFNKNLGKKKDE